MQLLIKTPRKSINKAYLKAGATREEIVLLKKNLGGLFRLIDEEESEEHVKNDIRDFLCNSFYLDYYVNTVGRTDLAIHLGKDNKSPAGILMECKKPLNKNEMIGRDRLNTKAMHELMLYYLRQRIQEGNNDIRQLVITNAYEWFVFDATEFEKHFFKNKQLLKDYKAWAAKEKVSSNTELFYNEIAATFLEQNENAIECTYFDLRSYAKLLQRDDKDKDLIPLLKLLSPEHLLKLPFANDSNRLEKSFYYELLHLIGLEEQKEKSKKLIRRPGAGKRNPGSLLENTMKSLETSEKLRNLKEPEKYGASREERLFNVALELNISWINRILFLKLLEAQLLKYHQGDESFRFLNTKTISDFDELNELFFEVLARREHERDPYLRDKYSRVPYLNSSLFEINSLEFDTIIVSNLKDRHELPIYNRTVLRDGQGRRLTGELPFLQYLFKFLDAYDFSSEGSGEVLRESKTLINASVLGLIFEKINGYREGSYFTPGFITMYMCRETIRRAVVQKFNEAMGTSYHNFAELKQEIDRRAEGRKQANRIINSLKICDPAVGSGHFLVSALNEIIAIKSELGVLSYRDGSRVQLYRIEIENDELIVTDEESHEIFEYTLSPLPDGKGWKAPAEKQKLQECLFHEKQNIIENCLFGVDINPNSVKICRLRLWIELLKNAYYKEAEQTNGNTNKSRDALPPAGGIEGGQAIAGGLETLPNIDINIKQGNSLISRFSLDTGISELLKRSNWSIEEYRLYVDRYRNATSREEKRGMMKMIEKVKSDFRTEIGRNDPKQKRLDKLGKEYYEKYEADRLLEVDMSEKQKAREKKERQKLEEKINKLSAEIQEIKDNKIYLDAFEWRFEFPEVLDDVGNFIGFDVVIGNPPYVRVDDIPLKSKELYKSEYKTPRGKYDLYYLFYERGINLVKKGFDFCYITPNRFTTSDSGQVLREMVVKSFGSVKINSVSRIDVFESASTYPAIIILHEKESTNKEIWLKETTSVEELPIFDEEGKFSLNQFNKLPLFILPLNSDRKVLDIYFRIGPLNQKFKNYVTIQEGLRIPQRFEDNQGDYHIVKQYQFSRYSDVKTGSYILKDDLLQVTSKNADRYVNCLKEKILIAEDALRIEATFDASGSICQGGIYFMSSLNELNMKAILGIINSKLIDTLYSNIFAGMHMGGGYMRYRSNFLHELPLAMDKNIYENISDHVTQILNHKQQDPEVDTSALEAEIDRMVYQLYGLTEEEVRVVEEGTK